MLLHAVIAFGVNKTEEHAALNNEELTTLRFHGRGHCAWLSAGFGAYLYQTSAIGEAHDA